MGKTGLHPFVTMISFFFLGGGTGMRIRYFRLPASLIFSFSFLFTHRNEEPYFRLPNLSHIFLEDANLEKYLEGFGGGEEWEK